MKLTNVVAQDANRNLSQIEVGDVTYNIKDAAALSQLQTIAAECENIPLSTLLKDDALNSLVLVCDNQTNYEDCELISFEDTISQEGVYSKTGTLLQALTAEDFLNKEYTISNNIITAIVAAGLSTLEDIAYIVIPANSVVPAYAFYGAIGLTTLILKEAVTVNSYSFGNCGVISVLKIGDGLVDKSGRTDEDGNVIENSSTAFTDTFLKYTGSNGTYLGGTTYDKYLNHMCCAGSTLVHFNNMDNELTSCEITSSFKIIGTNAFKDNTYLTQINISSNVQSLYKNAFNNNTALTKINISGVDDSNTTAAAQSRWAMIVPRLDGASTQPYICPIETWCFTTKNEDAYKCCYDFITNFNSNYTFTRGGSYDSSNISSNLGDINNSTYFIYSTDNITSETLETLKDYENVFFQKNTGIKKIPAQFLANNTKIKFIYLPDSIEDVGEGAFQGCTNLKSIKWSNSVNTIPANCFNGCSNLEDIYCNTTSLIIGENAFQGCDKIFED